VGGWVGGWMVGVGVLKCVWQANKETVDNHS